MDVACSCAGTATEAPRAHAAAPAIHSQGGLSVEEGVGARSLPAQAAASLASAADAPAAAAPAQDPMAVAPGDAPAEAAPAEAAPAEAAPDEAAPAEAAEQLAPPPVDDEGAVVDLGS